MQKCFNLFFIIPILNFNLIEGILQRQHNNYAEYAYWHMTLYTVYIYRL